MSKVEKKLESVGAMPQAAPKEEEFKEAVIFTGGIDSTLLLNEVKNRPNREVIPIVFTQIAGDDKRSKSIQHYLNEFNLKDKAVISKMGTLEEAIHYCIEKKINKLNVGFTIEDDPNPKMIELRMYNEQIQRDTLPPGEDPKDQFKVDIVAPFQTLTKSSIIEMCKDKGIKIEDTAAPHYVIEVDKDTGKNVYAPDSLKQKRIRDQAFIDARMQDPHSLIPKQLNK
jgi:7-cyano-7-deazaguanine synthase in queuosine biosynthesis